MSPRSKREYFENAYKRYKTASLRQKSAILDEVCQVLNCHRKWAITKLNNYVPESRRCKKKRKPGPKSQYDCREIKEPLLRIWQTSHLPCSKRLKAILPLWVDPYQEEYGSLEPSVTHRLKRISPATIDRILYKTRIKYRGKGRTTTKPGLLLRKNIPIKLNQWDEKKPGFVEADTVAHCGTTVEGVYANTLDVVDIASGWSEQRAVFGKGHRDVLAMINSVEKALPFNLLGFDCDNGGELLNPASFRYFTQRKKGVQFTRSRAYYSNDNAHVEQKNWTHVRQWLGYRRFENPRIVELLNDLYKNEWRLYQNFFLPSVKLLEKRRVASKIIKVHSSPMTPYQRLMNSKYVPNATKAALRQKIQNLNPFRLKAIIDDKIREIHRLAR